MERQEASFEIDSVADARAARRLLENVHDAVREETRTIRDGSDRDDVLSAFERLREAATTARPGQLTVTYEHHDEEFED